MSASVTQLTRHESHESARIDMNRHETHLHDGVVAEVECTEHGKGEEDRVDPWRYVERGNRERERKQEAGRHKSVRSAY